MDRSTRPAMPRIALPSIALALLAACSDSGVGGGGPDFDLSRAQPAAWVAHGSVRQIWLTDADAGRELVLTDARGHSLRPAVADAQGSLLLRDVEPGEYRVVAGTPESFVATGPLAVTAWDEHPDASFYEAQRIDPGYGYLETRDGTKLAINVYLPGSPEGGPYPTVIEYSGYNVADPDHKEPGTLLATTLGYAVVGVNMRGTGCSGGVYEFFEQLQSTDGYDIVETIAAQPWVKGHKVGMVGISFPGISQLFVAQTRPPHLAAITPLSVISDTGRGTLRPGGIFNDGFALEWAQGRRRDATVGGQPWSRKRLDAGEPVCTENMKLRGFTRDIIETVEANEYYVPEVADPLAPSTFVDRIEVPVLLAGAWQDEQVGGYFGNMLGRFTGSPSAHFAITNGGHAESVNSLILGRLIEFLRLYVDDTVPHRNGIESLLMTTVSGSIFGTTAPPIEPDRFAGITDLEQARRLFEADPPVWVLFENGAGGAPGETVPSFARAFDGWPIPGTVATAWYLGEGGRLERGRPSSDGADSFRVDTSHSHLTTLPGGGDGWGRLPAWVWPAPADGAAVAYESDPLDETLVMVGTGSVDLHLRSTAPDADLQATLAEVRPDGTEYFVQAGWLRASRRQLDEAASTELRPVSSQLREDARDLPAGESALVRIEIFPFAHVFRPGSRVRLIVDTPGGSRPRWTFETLANDGALNTIERSAAHPSRIVLPVVPGVEGVPAERPACPALRGQPCRNYAPAAP